MKDKVGKKESSKKEVRIMLERMKDKVGRKHSQWC